MPISISAVERPPSVAARRAVGRQTAAGPRPISPARVLRGWGNADKEDADSARWCDVRRIQQIRRTVNVSLTEVRAAGIQPSTAA